MIKQLLDADAKQISPKEYSPLVLAYMGDAVFELCVRTMAIGTSTAGVNALNKKVRALVNATAQAAMFDKIKDMLSEEERSVLMRGRNAKSHSASKSASLLDYRHATGLEALFGYLFLKEDHERIAQIFNQCIAPCEETEPATAVFVETE